MRDSQRFAMVMCCGALALLLTACDSIENPRTLAPGEPAIAETRSLELQRSQFEDIPVPQGFEFVTRGNRSFSYSRGGVRVGRFVYWGRKGGPDGVEEAAAFFRRTMKLRAYGWQLRSQDIGEDSTTFAFSKNHTDCTVTITHEKVGTYVRIDMAGPA